MPALIESIEFRLFSPGEVKKLAVAEINRAELYDNDGFPIEGGVMDPRLGTVYPGMRCRTCGLTLGGCPGHFGWIELVKPVIHVLYAKIIHRLLRTFCPSCGKAVGSGSAVMPKACQHCGTALTPIRYEKPYTYFEGEKMLNPLDIRAKLEKIPDEELQQSGFTGGRPEWLVLTILPVPPVIARPSITLETGERSEDDLTHKLVDIIRINQRLRENLDIGAPDFIIQDMWELLQYHVATFYDNELPGIPAARHRSGRSLKTLADRLKSKEGRFRQNLAGKRVNFSARTVISPDTHISINEVGVPLTIAEELTIPVVVHQNNIEEMKALIARAPVWPSANYIIRPDGKRKRITAENREEMIKELAPGYVVERHLQNGDVALFNRQPSLHRMSIMAHKIRVTPWRTFTLNTPVCVAPDTAIVVDGIQRPIEQLKNCWKESLVTTLDLPARESYTTELQAFWAIKPEHYGQRCWRITTNTGRTIVATDDHPFFTPDGKIAARDIEIGTQVLVWPHEFPPYEERNTELLTADDIARCAPHQTYITHAISELGKRGLLPLRMLNNPRIAILARLIGHLFGDGTFILKRDTARAIFRGAEADLENIRKDIRRLGFEPERIRLTTAGGKITTAAGKVLTAYGSIHAFEVRSKPFALLLTALGAPNGDKVMLSCGVPEWIKNSPKWVKKEFLATYFGCELSKPAVRKRAPRTPKEAVFKVAKLRTKDCRFVNDMKDLLAEFGIAASVSTSLGNIRVDGARSQIFIVRLASDTASLLRLYGTIGYAYNKRAESRAREFYHYLRCKVAFQNMRADKRAAALKMRKDGFRIKDIVSKTGVPRGTVEKWLYDGSGVTTTPAFDDFETWAKINCFGGGIVIERVCSKRENNVPYVFDITTVSETHNFIANGFLVSNCPPYNADFDGDEMNLHILQTEEAQVEAKLLMPVEKHVRSPRFGGPIIGLEHDHISGLYMLTREGTEMPVETAYSLLAEIGTEPNLPKRKRITGKEVFSALLPRGFSFTFKSITGEPVVIENGQLKKGVIDKKGMGRETGKLLDRIEREYGPEAARAFVDRASLLGIKWLERSGFTVGLDDFDLPRASVEKIKLELDKGDEGAKKLIEQFRSGTIDVLPGRTAMESLESHMLALLSKVAENSGEIIDRSVTENHAVVMARSGARGSITHMVQLTGCVGQERVLGQRVHRGYTGRTLPHFTVGDLSPAAHGFVASAFKRGLNPFEFFFDMLSGREGLMDKSLRTRHSGYLERRLMNALQDLKVEYDKTVRDNRKVIVQFTPGEDGIDPSKSDWGSVDVKRVIDTVVE